MTIINTSCFGFVGFAQQAASVSMQKHYIISQHKNDVQSDIFNMTEMTSSQIFTKIKQNISPPSVMNSGTRNACSLARTLVKFFQSATLLRVRNSRSFWLRSRGCLMWLRCSLCGHVMHSSLASSWINTSSASRRSERWTRFTFRVRLRASSNGRTSANLASASVVPIYTEHSLTSEIQIVSLIRHFHIVAALIFII